MRIPKFLAASALAVLFGCIHPAPATAGASFSFFYSNLSPYGSWTVSSSYGRVWQPSVYAVGWNPYYDGHWVYADVGWTWVSDYPWGDVCYHYGTWDFDPGMGWVWVPGDVWAPSWVVFRTGPDYIGWAPVSPRFSIGASFGDVDESRFVFVSAGNFLAPSVRSYAVPVRQTRVIFQQTRIINNIRIENNIVVNRGPDVREVERISGRPIRVMPIERVARVAPGGRFSRDEVRVDPQRMRHGIRVADPVSAREAIPAVERGRDNRREGNTGFQRQPIPDQPREPQKREGVRPEVKQDNPRPSVDSTERKARQGRDSGWSRSGESPAPRTPEAARGRDTSRQRDQRRVAPQPGRQNRSQPKSEKKKGGKGPKNSE